MRAKSTLKRALCLWLSLSLIFPPAALTAALPGEPNTADAAVDLEQFAKDYENACALIEELLPLIPRDTFDPKVILDQAQSEPTRLFI
jgi:hypothetical protein